MQRSYCNECDDICLKLKKDTKLKSKLSFDLKQNLRSLQQQRIQSQAMNGLSFQDVIDHESLQLSIF